MSNSTNPYIEVQPATLDFYEEVLACLDAAYTTLHNHPATYVRDSEVRAVDTCGEMVDPWDHRAVQWSARGTLQVHDWKYVEFWLRHDDNPGIQPPDLFPSDAAINLLDYELRDFGGLNGPAGRPHVVYVVAAKLKLAKLKLEARLEALRVVVKANR